MNGVLISRRRVVYGQERSSFISVLNENGIDLAFRSEITIIWAARRASVCGSHSSIENMSGKLR
jgi:hypothetical protein